MRVLVITNLFPNAQHPTAAPFNRRQFVALGALCEVTVIAHIPWFPFVERFREFSPHGDDLGRIPAHEVIDGLPVSHPRTLYLPKVGGALAGLLCAGSLARSVLPHRGRVDVVLGSWAYPDGWAAIVLGRLLGVPVVVKVHGSDLNLVAELPGPRRMLRAALPGAAGVVAVSRQLADRVEALGVDRERIRVIYNGVDGSVFLPRDRLAARQSLGRRPGEKLVFYVGNLRRSKGVLDLLRAFAVVAAALPEATLVMAGRGEDAAACQQLARELGDRVTFIGPRPHGEIATWLAACDLLCLPSHHEGTPNCVLEALACGRRVVATRVGGVPDLLVSDRLGLMVPPRDPPALAAALLRALPQAYDAGEVAREGRRGDWAESARELHAALCSAVAR